VTSSPGFSARSGLGVVVTPQSHNILVIAGWPHFLYIWSSSDNGNTFTQISDLVWNCNEDKCGKFDFWPLIHNGSLYTLGGSAAYSTFGSLYQDTWVLNLSLIAEDVLFEDFNESELTMNKLIK